MSRVIAETAARKVVLGLLGLSFGGLCLWLAVRGVDWREVRGAAAMVDPSWIATAVALQGLNLLLRSARWRELLLFAAPVRASRVFDALLVGYAVNAALPARLGELFRADRLARAGSVSRSTALASIVVERLLDLAMAVSLLLTGLGLVSGADAKDSAQAVVRYVAIAGALLAVAVAAALIAIGRGFASGQAETLVLRLLRRLRQGPLIARRLGAIADDFASFARVLQSRRFLAALAMTLPIWAIETAAIWSICRAAQVELGFAALLCLMGGISLSTVLPTAPGFVGSYQYAWVLIFGQLGLDAATALVAATTSQIFLIGTYAIAGLLLFALSLLAAGHARP
ncbi:MAG: flippase-like domain-containing protein [Alphaproteobacteria bacterium]|nr:flippase-like domain-containing protein [Alphaproteobacteria bacterium]